MSRPQSPLSRQSTPAGFSSPARTPDPPVVAPYLPAVPSLLAPLSPSLSALHAARINLLLELPPEAAQEWCCGKCGALRAGYGWKVVRVKRERAGQGRSERAAEPRGSKRRKVECAEDQASRSAQASRPREPAQRPKNKLQGTCGVCGARFSMSGSVQETLDSFPSTRKTRRKKPEVQEADIVIPSRAEASTGMESSIPSSAAASPSSQRSPSPKPQPPSLLRGSPSLSHIPISDPNPVTIPFPAVRPSELPSSTASSRSTSPIGGLPVSAVAVSSASGRAAPGPRAAQGLPPAAKKRKKSGLARLLAESEKRKEQDQASGSALGRAWGLG